MAEEPDLSEDSDDEIPYWPGEDHDSAVIEAEEAHRLVLKWVPEAESAIRKPHIWCKPLDHMEAEEGDGDQGKADGWKQDS